MLVADSVTGGVSPVPLSAMVCGEVLALSVMVIVANNAPVAVGAKCPWIVQLAATARLAPQLFANTNEEAPAPVTAMLVIVTAAVPLFVTVTVCEPLEAPTVVGANERLVADKVTGGSTPVPLNAIVCGELIALSVIVTAAVSVPDATGAKCP